MTRATLLSALLVAVGLAFAATSCEAQVTDLKPKQVFKDCVECPDMVVLPKGAFVMGGNMSKREQPKHPVFIKKRIAMSRFEITFDQWEACLRARACTENPDDHGWGKGRHPIMNVNFYAAQGYAKWLSEKTGKRYRLPSEAEWEFAARAGTTTKYWFGDDPGDGRINCKKCGTLWSGKGNAPVGSFAPNPWGLYDMHGNAYEWVSDCWVPNYKGAPRDGRARTDGNCDIRVIRGGSWYYFARQARSASRAKNPAAVKSYWLSFRVVRELAPAELAPTGKSPARKTPAK